MLFALPALGVHLVVTLLVAYCSMILGRRGKECLTKDAMDGGTALSTPTQSSLGMLPSRQLRQVFRYMKKNLPSSGWDEVLTASNAAICGPSMAAAFSSGIRSSPDSRFTFASGINHNNNNASVVERKRRIREDKHQSATVWGVFGYAIAIAIAIATGKYECRSLHYIITMYPLSKHVFI